MLPAMRSLECWQNAQTKRPQDLEADLHTRGCLQPLRMLFESHAVHVGAVVAAIIVPVCISVCLSNILAKQIDHQHYLLEREARRCERRRRRERHRFRDPFASCDKMERGLVPPLPPSNGNDKKNPAADEVHSHYHDFTFCYYKHVWDFLFGTSRTSSWNVKFLPKVEKARLSPYDSKESSTTCEWRMSASIPASTSANGVAPAVVTRHERGEGQPKKHRRRRTAVSSSPRRAAQAPPSLPLPRGVSVESALAHKHAREKKRRSTASQVTAEDRTHQWVLQQPDPVNHEPIA
ncbi:unnamed protein product [Toxocara canis]|uniref:Transmembrane protein n=1 Tax=Toxocara canis TaxID=6265 RepID=A0A3P7ICD7_TOXCA|nr:unnamed protein product [Toxocara canis]